MHTTFLPIYGKTIIIASTHRRLLCRLRCVKSFCGLVRAAIMSHTLDSVTIAAAAASTHAHASVRVMFSMSINPPIICRNRRTASAVSKNLLASAVYACWKQGHYNRCRRCHTSMRRCNARRLSSIPAPCCKRHSRRHPGKPSW